MADDFGRTKKLIIGAVLAIASGIALVIWLFLPKRDAPPEVAKTLAAFRRASGSLARVGPDQRPLTSKIVGKVRTSDGKAIPALVYVLALDKLDSSAPKLEIPPRPTDGSGRFEFPSLLPGSYAVTATAAGHAPAYRAPVDVALGTPSEVELVLGGSGIVLSGNVLDAEGGPIPEATLAADWKRFELVTDGSRRVFQFKADANGRFTAHLQAGHYRVMVAADGYAPAEYWTDLTASLQRNFSLQRAGSIAGRVVAGPAGEPVASALVELMVTGANRVRPSGGDARAPAKVSEAMTDTQGVFRFSGISAGNYLLVARKGKLVGQRTGLVTVEPGNAVENADVELSAGLFVQGRVISGTSVPIARARVSLAAGDFNPHLVQVADTAADGSFSIEGLLPGVYRLDARANGFGSFMKELLLQGPSVGHEIVLPADTSVQGRLFAADEQQIVSAAVTLWNAPVPNPRGKERITRSLLTDAQGGFVFDGLIPGYFWLEAADGKGIAALGPESIVAGETRRVDLRFDAGISVSGQVKWKGGGPAGDVLVRCKGTLLDRSARTDAAGNYRCSGLIPDAYVVAAVKNLADEPWYLSLGAGHPAEKYGGRFVELSAGKSEEGVNLELNREGHSVSGVVVAPDGTPAANVAVYASQEAFGVSYQAFNARAVDGKAVTLDDGTFQIDDLPEGSYELRAQSVDGEGRQDNVPAGGEARILLERTGVLRGVVFEGQRRPVTSFTISVYLGADTSGMSYSDAVVRVEGPAIVVQSVFDAAGRFEVAGLRPGNYEVVASTTDKRSGRAAAVLAKDKAPPDLAITLDSGSTLTGHVLDYESGGPVAKCRVSALFSERQVDVATEADGSFKLTGPAVGQTVRLQFHAGGYIVDFHTATVKATGGDAVANIGSIKLIRGAWRGIKPRLLDWLLEGRIDNTLVVAVRPGSQAAEAGVVPGAVVLKVGEKDAQHLGPISVHYLGSAAGAVASMVLRLPNGSIHTFQL